MRHTQATFIYIIRVTYFMIIFSRISYSGIVVDIKIREIYEEKISYVRIRISTRTRRRRMTAAHYVFISIYIRVVVDENFLIDRWSLISRIKIYCRFFVTISLGIRNLWNSLTVLRFVYYTTIKCKRFLTGAWTIFYFW